MIRTFRSLVLICVSVLGISNAHALIGDVRLNYGTTSGKPSDYNKAYFNFQDGPKIDSQTYIGIDAIAMLPAIPFGFGLRYEATGDKDTYLGNKIDYVIKRVALVVNYRIIDTLFYVGPIATYGLSHDLHFAIPTDPDVFKSKGDSSYSIGAEAGLKFGMLRLGAEVGYMSLVFDKLTDINGAAITNNGLAVKKLDFSGSYFKAHLGVGF